MFWFVSAVDTSPAVKPLSAEPLGIDPQAHRVLALAEDLDAADAGDALEVVRDVVFQVIRHHLVGERRIVRREADAHDEVPLFFETATPVSLTSFGKIPVAMLTAFCTSLPPR